MSTGALPGLLDNWVLAPAAPDRIAEPSELNGMALDWIAAPVPGTVAQALLAAGRWDFEDRRDLDAFDWWYRCPFAPGRIDPGVPARLRFQGLATRAEVWLNGERILNSDNMFQAHVTDVTRLLRETNDLVLCFRALTRALAARRPRPRWKTRLVSHQQLRFIRTSLLGRMPGWSPPVAPVGPWRAISLELWRPGTFTDLSIQPRLEGGTGVVEVSAFAPHAAEAEVAGTLSVGHLSAELRAEREREGSRLSGQLRIDDPARWWPHTHGAPRLYPASARLVVNGEVTTHDCGGVGFRDVRILREDDGFALHVNDVPVFCRGACWTVDDIVSLAASPHLLRTLTLLRDAGANMVRVGGTMVYESDDFYRACDELGLLVWQDFMFARMDYPEDGAFVSSVTTEATQQVRRLSRHPSVALYCGNSEVEQQAAMVGVPRDAWRSPLFSEVLPEICARWHPAAPYVPSTPSGGAMPFHADSGITHYYGVGAYLRPVADARRAGVRFTPECLGFANVPSPDVVALAMEEDPPAMHDPRWKRRIPRDSGAGWDFEDVRDHYLGDLFGVDPVHLRSADTARYLDLSRVTSGEVMSRVFAEWRGAHSGCHGALVWFLKDLWPGAGWGILDSRGLPKACFYYLRRAWQPRAVLLTDEGLNGIHLHLVNDTDRPLSATLELVVLRDGRVTIAQAKTACAMGPHTRALYGSDALLGGFHDVSYAYRFGPPSHDVVAATLYGTEGEIVSEAFWCPGTQDAARRRHQGSVQAGARRLVDDCYEMTMTTERFLYGAHIDAPGFLPDDDYFHLMPGRRKVVRLQPIEDAPPPFSGHVEALNLDDIVGIDVEGRG